MATKNVEVPTLVFDGDCGFCTLSARWIERRLPDGTAVTPWQFIDDLDAIGLSQHDVDTKVWWVTPDGHRTGGNIAVGDALRSAGGFWGLVGRVSLLPPFVWLGAPIYALISKNRHRMPGGTPACRIDSPR